MAHKRNGITYTRHNPAVPNPNTPRAWSMMPVGHTVFNPPLLSVVNDLPPPCGLDVSGKIGQTVYQRTLPWVAQGIKSPRLVTQLRRHVIPFDPRTWAQLLIRARFAAANAAWQGLTAEEQSAYNVRANRREPPIDGRNLWIKDYCRTHPAEDFSLQAEALRAGGTEWKPAPEPKGGNMAQITKRHCETMSWPLPTTALTDVPDLTATITTGAGWILIHLDADLQNGYAGLNWAQFTCLIDGVEVDTDPQTSHIAQAEYIAFHKTWAFQPGAGQHTIKIQGKCNLTNVVLIGYGTYMIVHEPGY